MSVLRLFGRLVVCSVAFIVAAAAASLIGVFGLYRGLEADPAYEVAFLSTSLLALLTVAHSSALPFGVFIVLSEAFRLRSFILHAVAPVGVAFFLLWNVLDDPFTLDDDRVIVACGAALMGGFVYWLLAGRRAGAFRDPIYST